MTLITVLGVVWMLAVIGLLLLFAWACWERPQQTAIQRLRSRRFRDRHRHRLALA